jgi:pantoate--beta-alanine ligase
LIRWARRENNIVVVSIFVNPTQFGPKEDFKHYPRPLKKDFFLCRQESVDFIFYPTIKDIYPRCFATYVYVEGLSNLLCGESRPGHFRAVTTIVTKLLNIVHPDTAYFGQKDAQQAIIIKKMVSDLNIPVRIKVMPTVRDEDGLALSSRNMYLNSRERQDALVLFQSLKLGVSLIKSGERDAGKIIGRMSKLIREKNRAKIDYICVVDLKNLKPVKRISKNCLIALAVRIGKTRLIDNTIIKI